MRIRFGLGTKAIAALALAAAAMGAASAGESATTPPGADAAHRPCVPASPAEPGGGACPGTTGSTGSLSDQLAHSDGTIHPPAVDPGMVAPTPDIGAKSTPVIAPPGSPGGNPQIQPK